MPEQYRKMSKGLSRFLMVVAGLAVVAELVLGIMSVTRIP